MKSYYPALQLAAGIYSAYRGYTSRTTTTTRQKRKRNNNFTMNTTRLRQSRRTGGRYKRRTAALANRRLDRDEEHVILRWQNVSRFGYGPGAQGIWTHDASGNIQVQPMHVFDLTSFHPGNPLTGPITDGMYSVGINTLTGDLTYTLQRSQDNTGTTNTPGSNFYEYGSVNYMEQGKLRWMDLKMNLYGSYYAPVKWRISLVRVHDEKAIFGSLTTEDRQKLMIDSFLKPFKYSNLLTNTGYQKLSYKVLKQFNYVIEPFDRGDVPGTDETSYLQPNVVEFKYFHKFDKFLRYNWHDTATAANLTADTPNTNIMQSVSYSNLHDTVYPSQRVFLVIQATCPDKSLIDPDTSEPTRSTTNLKASYDIVLRRKFETPSK